MAISRPKNGIFSWKMPFFGLKIPLFGHKCPKSSKIHVYCYKLSYWIIWRPKIAIFVKKNGIFSPKNGIFSPKINFLGQKMPKIN